MRINKLTVEGETFYQSTGERYFHWTEGEKTATLDGTFTVLDLQQIILTMSQSASRSHLEQVSDESAYTTLEKMKSPGLEVLKVTMRNGKSAETIEEELKKTFPNWRANLSYLMLISAAYHIQRHPELLIEQP